jgi:hypothetical protein
MAGGDLSVEGHGGPFGLVARPHLLKPSHLFWASWHL